VTLGLLALQGCAVGSDAEPVERAEWRIITGDTRGVVVTDGRVTRGFARGDATPLWELEGDPSGAACAGACPDAVVTLFDDSTVYEVRDRTITERQGPKGVSMPAVLTATGSSAVFVGAAKRGTTVIALQGSRARRLASAKVGAPVWRGTGTTGSLFLLQEEVVSVVQIGQVPESSHLAKLRSGMLCFDAGRAPVGRVPAPVRRALGRQLEYVSECFRSDENTWVGLDTYMQVADASGEGLPMVELVAVDRGGDELWSRTLTDADGVDFSGDGSRVLAVSGGEGTFEAIGIATGETQEEVTHIDDARHADDQLVLVRSTGIPEWATQ
jgi:hypothetical protein